MLTRLKEKIHELNSLELLFSKALNVQFGNENKYIPRVKCMSNIES